MSGIFGLIHLDGAPIGAEAFARMESAMRGWGPDGLRQWSNSTAGLGQCLLFDSPESPHERLPHVSANGRLAFTAEARIDNRDELCERLGESNRRTLPDGELLRLAYERWGESCPEYVLGDWSLAAWNIQERRLFLARDHHGNTSLYYFHDGRRLVFASDRRAILSLPDVPRRLNELQLAQILVAWPGYHGPDTIYLDVHRLPPAHALAVSPAHLRTWRYWRLEDAPDVRLKTRAEYADGLREQLGLAVRSRARSYRRTAVTLSGGLDSGAVAVLAAPEVAQLGRSLLALTSVPLSDRPTSEPNRMVNEFEWAAATAQHAGNVEHIAVTADGVSPLDGIDRMLEVHGQPMHAASNYYWMIAVLQAARDRGADVVLTGQNGNFTISWNGLPSPRSAAAFVLQGQLQRAASETVAWLSATPPVWLLRRRRRTREAGGQEPWRAYSAIHPEFSARLRLREQMASAGHDPTFARRPRHARELILRGLRPGRATIGALWAELGAAAGVAVRDPTEDVRVLTFVTGIPDWLWRGPLDRWLLRDAMRGRLPDVVRLNHRRGRQAGDLVARMRAHSDETQELLDELAASEIVGEYVDVGYLRDVAGRMLNQDDTDIRDAVDTILLRGMAAGAFLARRAVSPLYL